MVMYENRKKLSLRRAILSKITMIGTLFIILMFAIFVRASYGATILGADIPTTGRILLPSANSDIVGGNSNALLWRGYNASDASMYFNIGHASSGNIIFTAGANQTPTANTTLATIERDGDIIGTKGVSLPGNLTLSTNTSTVVGGTTNAALWLPYNGADASMYFNIGHDTAGSFIITEGADTTPTDNTILFTVEHDGDVVAAKDISISTGNISFGNNNNMITGGVYNALVLKPYDTSSANLYINQGHASSGAVIFTKGTSQVATDNTVTMRISNDGAVGINAGSNPGAPNGLYIGDGRYLHANDNNAGAPPAADCNEDWELGRFTIDTSNNRLYICNGATRLWDYVGLTD